MSSAGLVAPESLILEHHTARSVSKGSPFPLGATPGPDGVNFALCSKSAAEVFLLLVDTPDGPRGISFNFATAKHPSGMPGSRGSGPANCTATRSAANIALNGACISTAPNCFDPYPRAVTGKFRNVDNLLLAYDARPGADRLPPMPATTATSSPKPSWSTTVSLTGRAFSLPIAVWKNW
jgi:isoamylase